MDNSVTMENIALWNKEKVNEFLRKNKIYGCSQVVTANNIDGIGFLSLSATTLNTMTLTIMEQCKINALLNSIAPESERRVFIDKWSQPSENFQKNTHQMSQHVPTNSKLFLPPVPKKPTDLRAGRPPQNFQAPPDHSSKFHSHRKLPGPPVPPLPPNKPKALNNFQSFDDKDYEVLKETPTFRYNSNNVEECDLFSSDEFSDDEEDVSNNSQDASTLIRPFVSVTNYTRQPDPTSTPPPLPYRNNENHGGSSTSLNSDRSNNSTRKLSLPSLGPPPPPPSRSPSVPATSHFSRDPSPTVKRNDDLTLTQPWYFKINRRDAERLLKQCVEGAFLLRPTEHGGQNHRYTMSVIFNRRVFHIPVRQKPNGLWALGSEKFDEETFKSVQDLVEDHRMSPINLHTEGRLVGTTCLVIWPSKQSL